MGQQPDERGKGSIINIDFWHRASLSWSRRLYESKWGFWSIVGAIVLNILMLSVVNWFDPGPRNSGALWRPVDPTSLVDILSFVALVVAVVVLSINSLFILWYLYISVFGLFIVRFLRQGLGWLTGPIPSFKGINWRCRLPRQAIPYFGITSRHLASRLEEYRSANETRGLFKRFCAFRLTPLMTRLGGIALLIYAVVTVQQTWDLPLWDAARIPTALSIAAALALLALHVESRRQGRPNHPIRQIWGRRLLGVLAFVGAFAALGGLAALIGMSGVTQDSSVLSGLLVVCGLILAGWMFEKLMLASSWQRHVAQRLALPSAASVLSRDSRLPILYLRPFSEDDAWIDAQALDIGGLIDADAFAEEGGDSFETSFVDNLKSFGPVVAIANPGELPAEGAARHVAGDDTWRSTVWEWMRRAELIFIVLGTTPGVGWELDQIVGNNLFGKTIFLLPAKSNLDLEWRFLERRLKEPALTGVRQIRKAGVRAFYLSRNGRAVAFASSKPTDLAYRLATQFAIFGLKVHEQDLAAIRPRLPQ